MLRLRSRVWALNRPSLVFISPSSAFRLVFVLRGIAAPAVSCATKPPEEVFMPAPAPAPASAESFAFMCSGLNAGE